VSDYRLIERVPSVENYNRIRIAAGLAGRDPQAVEIGLSNTLFGVCVERDGRIVGFGRLVGDGGLFFEVVDVAVLPEHQRSGLGKMIMDTLTSWLRDNAPRDAYVKLIAEGGTTGFYERYGFRARTQESSGMSFMTL
jgi:ribosomal protein S18 acetylase RimI-like enzyme